MKKSLLIGAIALIFTGISHLGYAQDQQAESKTAKKEKKEKKRKLWGGYDSSAVKRVLIIQDAFVTKGETLLPGVVVLVKVNDQLIQSDTTDQEGGFQFELNFDYRYILSFEKAGYVTKLVEIDLVDMPDDAKRTGYDIGRFNMRMLPYSEGMDVEEYKVPVARYYYSDVNRQVQWDREFTKKRKELLEQVALANSKVVADNQAVAAEIDEEYDILIRDADIEFEAKDYKLAKEIYLEAIKLKTTEEYPRDQLKVINAYLAQDLGEEEKYQTLITQGDEAFNEKDYEAAELSYKNAIKIKTTESYPREQLQKIEDLKSQTKKVEVKEEEKVYSLANVQISNDRKGYSNELAKKYPQGLTVEKYTEGSKTIEKRIIVEGDVGVEFKKVVHNWGGVYYFKNNKASNHFVWQKEAIQ